MAIFHIGSVDGRPGCTVSELLLPNITSVSCEGMVERGAIDVLRMQRKVIRTTKIDPALSGIPLPAPRLTHQWAGRH